MLLSKCIQEMVEKSFSAVVVCENHRPMGIFSEHDLLNRVVGKGISTEKVSLKDVMTPEPFVANADDELEGIFEKMRAMKIRHAPVVDKGELVGILSVRDLFVGGQLNPGPKPTVGSWMTDRPLTAVRGDELQGVIERMAEHNIGAVVVIDGEAIVGIFTERDVLKKVVARRLNPLQTRVGDVMTPRPVCIKVEDDFETVYETMFRLNVRHLPVTRDDKLVGIVSIRDVFRARERMLEHTVAEKMNLLQNYQAVLDEPKDERLHRLVYETERLKNQAGTDELTQLPNRRAFQSRMEEEFSRALRYKRLLSVALCDVDFFKRLNDTYGHKAGDEVLADVAKLLANSLKIHHLPTSFRRSDVVARYGGEEFVIIFPETEENGAHLACERVRKTIEEHPFLAKMIAKPVQVTMSFGVAAFPVHAGTAEELIVRADEALYRAKGSGRNRVVIFSS